MSFVSDNSKHFTDKVTYQFSCQGTPFLPKYIMLKLFVHPWARKSLDFTFTKTKKNNKKKTQHATWC